MVADKRGKFALLLMAFVALPVADIQGAHASPSSLTVDEFSNQCHRNFWGKITKETIDGKRAISCVFEASPNSAYVAIGLIAEARGSIIVAMLPIGFDINDHRTLLTEDQLWDEALSSRRFKERQ